MLSKLYSTRVFPSPTYHFNSRDTFFARRVPSAQHAAFSIRNARAAAHDLAGRPVGRLRDFRRRSSSCAGTGVRRALRRHHARATAPPPAAGRQLLPVIRLPAALRV